MRSRPSKGCVLPAILTVVLLAVTAPVFANGKKADKTPIDPALEQLIERFDTVQRAVLTLSADFTMVTSNSLLKEPVVSEGRLYLTKPDAVRWEFTSPEEMSFVIANDEYMGYFPKRKKAERRDFHRWSEQLFQYFGLGQCSDDLSKMYDIHLEPTGEEGDSVHVLRLEPQKRRAKKRMKAVLLWVDSSSYLPVKVVYNGKNGSSRKIEFRNMRMNPVLSATLYEMDLPPDVRVERGFSGIGGSLQPASDSSTN